MGSEGKITKVSNCNYFFGVDDAALWWDLPYYKALEKKRYLINEVLKVEVEKPFMDYDSNKIKRLCDAVDDINKWLDDKPKGN